MRISDWSSDVCSSDLRLASTLKASGISLANSPILAAAAAASSLVPFDAFKYSVMALALPPNDFISTWRCLTAAGCSAVAIWRPTDSVACNQEPAPRTTPAEAARDHAALGRSEEHTSELQSLNRSSYALFS